MIRLLALAAALLLPSHAHAQWRPANLSSDEELALRGLCHIGLHANNGNWSSARINAAISMLAFGSKKTDSPQATAYKICN